MRIYFYGVQGVASSNPAVPTKQINGLQMKVCSPFLFLGLKMLHAPTHAPTKGLVRRLFL